MRPASATLAGDASSIRLARALVDRSIDQVPIEVRHTAVLLTSEVVTNAVLHGGGSFTLSVEVTEDRLRVSVSDHSPRAPDVLVVSSEREHGRGMAIVASQATAWGARLDGHRKTVWFELALPEDPEEAPDPVNPAPVRPPGRAWRGTPTTVSP